MSDTFQCSVNVIPLIKTDSKYISLIQEAMQDVIPYIETLTQVRYYPVTTYIVDKYCLKKRFDLTSNNNDDLDDPFFIEELIRFLEGLSLLFHCGRHTYHINYKDFSSLPEKTVKELKEKAEYQCESLRRHLFGTLYGIEPIYIQGVSSRQDTIENFFDNFREIIGILQMMCKSNDFANMEMDFDSNRAYPRIEVWKRILNKSDFNKIISCIGPDSGWKRDLESLIIVTQITLQELNRLIKELLKRKSKFYSVIKNMETYGVYLHRNSENKKFNDLVKESGLPDNIISKNTGKVLICIEQIKEDIIEISNKYPDIEIEELIYKFIKSILVHEHTHALTFEGVKHDCNQPLYSSKKISGIKYDVVVESVAEWAQMNYFRNDKIMFDIIRSHAEHDNYTQWPYAGALFIENRFDRLGLTDFHCIFEMSRVDIEHAYYLLKV